MITAVTYGVKISVESIYRKDLSHAEHGLFFFNYRIVIENKNDFENYFTNLKIDLKEYCEFSIFPLSGGVTAKTPMPRLPIFVLKCFNFLDKILVKLSPRIFALGMRVVISKK